MAAPPEFEWDEAKNEATRRTRGFGFNLAIRIFSGPLVEEPDTRRDYGELRIRAIGEFAGRVMVVVYTDRGEVRRIISARRANRKERAKWLLSAKR